MMIENMQYYVEKADENKLHQFQYFQEHGINISDRIERQNALYGYNTIPDEEWFIEGKQIVISTHGMVRIAKKVPNKVPRLHNHDFFEMNYVYRGTLYNKVEDAEVIEEENSLMLLSPRARHLSQTQSNEDIVFNILIKREVVEKIFLQIFSESEYVCRFFMDSLYNINLRQPYLLFQCTAEIQELLHTMIGEFFQENSFYQSIMVAKLIELFSMLSREYAKMNTMPITKQDDFAISFNQYVEMYYPTAKLSDAAEFFGYTSSSFSRLIRSRFQKTFSDILRETRIKYACRYLTHSSISIEQIAEIVGYQDVNYFYRIFKEQIGISPVKYRNQSTLLKE